MRLWEDGFDHYGDASHTLDGPYAQYDGEISSAQVATGTASWYMNNEGGLLEFDGLRKVLPSAVNTIGCAARFYFPVLPTTNYMNCIFGLMPSDTLLYGQLGFSVGINGEIHVIRKPSGYSNFNLLDLSGAESAVVIGSSDPLITAGAFHHIEVQAFIDDAAGWVRIAVNGIHRYLLSGVDTKGSDTTANIGSVAQYQSTQSEESNWFYMDDYYIYDFTGDSAIDTDFCPNVGGDGIATNYIGDLQVWPLFPNGDTAEADFVLSTGTDGYALIDEHSPNDDTYIYSENLNDLSEFELDDLPPEITYIRGLGQHIRMSKSDGGSARVKVGMKSVAATFDNDERPLTVIPTYWRDACDVDPNSGSRWTRASLNAGKVRFTRSA